MCIRDSDKADAAHLKQIVQIFPPSGKLLHHAQHKAQVSIYHLLARLFISVFYSAQKRGLFLFLQNRKLRRVYAAKLHLVILHALPSENVLFSSIVRACAAHPKNGLANISCRAVQESR